MRVEVVGSGSTGNAYIVTVSDGSHLLLDAGLSPKCLIRALGGVSNLVGALVTHEHQDHAKAVLELVRLGIPVYMSAGTRDALQINGVQVVRSERQFTVGVISVLPFRTEHDAAEPLGFLLRDNHTGEILLYATDTYYVRYRFPGVTHWLVECNYMDELVEGMENTALRDRLLHSHMGLNRLKELLMANNLSTARIIILCHLSNERADEAAMVESIHALTGIQTVAADAGRTFEA